MSYLTSKLRLLVTYLVIVSFVMFTIAPMASAEEKMRTTPVPTVSAMLAPPAIAPIKKGQLAPFDGVVLNGTAIAQITVDKEHAKDECDITVKAEVAKQKAFDDASSADKDSELKYTRDTLTQQIKDREDEIAKMRKENVTASSSGLTWGIVGAGGGILLTVGLVFLVSLAQK